MSESMQIGFEYLKERLQLTRQAVRTYSKKAPDLELEASALTVAINDYTGQRGGNFAETRRKRDRLLAEAAEARGSLRWSQGRYDEASQILWWLGTQGQFPVGTEVRIFRPVTDGLENPTAEEAFTIHAGAVGVIVDHEEPGEYFVEFPEYNKIILLTAGTEFDVVIPERV